jgi:hypothetical protein
MGDSVVVGQRGSRTVRGRGWDEPPLTGRGHRRGQPQLGGRTLTTAWIPSGKLEQPEWAAVGRRFGTVARCSQWWIGDWIRYGIAEWGEKYSEAARITGYDPGTLRNMAWVAGQFDLSLRNDKLSWSHHALLAPLPVQDKRLWLERASVDRLSVSDLRLALRDTLRQSKAEDVDLGERHPAAAVDEPGSERERPGNVTCPHCGHVVPLEGAVRA